MNFIIVLAVIFSTMSVFAETSTVLTLQRLNYKPEKKLIYDLNYNAVTCEIDLSNPFDVYYRDNTTGERLEEFSNDSQKYFGLKLNASIWRKEAVSLEFKAFDEIKKATNTNASITVSVIKEGEQCSTVTEYANDSEKVTISNIDIESKLIFGLPLGVDWVSFVTETDQGPVKMCVLGNCQ